MFFLPKRFFDQRPYWLLGFAATSEVRGLGREVGRFAGADVVAEASGPVTALICEAPHTLFGDDGAPGACAARVLPVLTALSAIVAFVPVRPGAAVRSVAEARRLCKERGPEIGEIIAAHGDSVQVVLSLGFDSGAAMDEGAMPPALQRLSPQTETEAQLAGLAAAQDVAGRRAAFEARCRRIISQYTNESGCTRDERGRWCLLVRRGDRAQLRAALSAVAAETGAGARVDFEVFCAPLAFHWLDIACADPALIGEARAALGVAETTYRQSIQMAYRRALERVDPGALRQTDATNACRKLSGYFHILDQVADGQIKAVRGGLDTRVRLTGKPLEQTWLVRFETAPPVETRAA